MKTALFGRERTLFPEGRSLGHHPRDPLVVVRRPFIGMPIRDIHFRLPLWDRGAGTNFGPYGTPGYIFLEWFLVTVSGRDVLLSVLEVGFRGVNLIW